MIDMIADNQKTILIAGGAGFIGVNLIHYMINKYPHYIVINLDKLAGAANPESLIEVSDNKRYTFIQGDICDRMLVEGIFGEYSIDYVVNLAAESYTGKGIGESDCAIRSNVLGAANLLNIAKKHWACEGGYLQDKKFLQVSTSKVYGSLGVTGFFTEFTPLDPHNAYAASKAGADLIAKAFYDAYRMPVNIIRGCNNYGPYQLPEKLIPRTICSALQKKPLPVYGDGLNVRDWLHVEDYCSALDMVLHEGCPGEIYNVGGHNERTNIHIVRTIIAYMNEHVDKSITESLIKYVHDRPGHDRRHGIDSQKIREELGWYPKISFDKGLTKTIRWYLETKAWVNSTLNEPEPVCCCSGKESKHTAKVF